MKNIRFITAALVCALLLPLAACGGQGSGDGTLPESTLPTPQDTAGDNTETTAPSDHVSGSDSTAEPDSATSTEPDTTPVEPPAADPDALAALLSAGIYASETPLTGVAGFTDPASVGIRESQMAEVRYPVPADGDCAKVYRVSDYGITPDSADNSAALAALLEDAAKTEGVKKVVFSEGVYRFGKTLTLRGLSDLYLCGETEDTDYTILMTAWTPGIEVADCTNLHFNGFTFDYDHPTAVTGSVVSSDVKNATVTIRVDDAYDLTYGGYNGGRVNYGSYMEFTYDEANGVYIPDGSGNLWYNSTGDGIRNIKDGVYDPATRELTLTFNSIKRVKEGTRVNVAYTMYEYFGLYASDSRDLYLEGVTFHHTAGMTFGANHVENISVNRMRISPPAGSDRLMTATADCLHFGSCTGKITVSNSYFSHSHDDTMNVKGAYIKVRYNLPRAIAYDHGSGNIRAKVGDVLDAYEVATFRYLGSYTVTAVDTVKHTYTVAEPITEDLTGALLCNASDSPSLTVENCFIGDKRNRGMLIQCREVMIRNCTFRNILHGPIQILSVADVFAEGIMPRNVTVQGCKFLNNTVTDVDIFTWGPEGTSSGTITGVSVTHNFFSGSGSNAVQMLGAGQSSVSGNFFHDVNRGSAVLIRTSEGIEVTDNYGLFSQGIRKSIYSVTENCRGITLSGNVTYGKGKPYDEPTRKDEPLPTPPAPQSKPFAPSVDALTAGFTYDWSPDGVTMELTDSGFETLAVTELSASLKAVATPANGFGTHTLLMNGKGDYTFTGLSYAASRDFCKAGTVYYLTLPVASASAASLELVALTANGTRTVTAMTLTEGAQTLTLAYRVAEGDRGFGFRVTEGGEICLGSMAVELSDGGPTLSILRSPEGFTWDMAAVAFENSRTATVESLTDTAAREALLAAGYGESDPVCIVTGGILQDFFKPEFFVPGTTYELTFRTYAAASHGYLIAMDSTPGNFAQTGNDFIGRGYCERTVTYTVGDKGDYALTFYNIPETYLVGMTFRIVE